MLRGTTTFICTKCNNLFKAPDYELNATVYSVPQRCPCCKSIRTRPYKILGFLENGFYEPIWKSMEEGL